MAIFRSAAEKKVDKIYGKKKKKKKSTKDILQNRTRDLDEKYGL